MVLTIPSTTVYCPPMTLFIIVFMITWRHSTVNAWLMVKAKSIVSNGHDAFLYQSGLFDAAHGEADAAAFKIDIQHFDAHNLAHMHHGERIFDIAV